MATKKTSIGGQALMEGIMMRGPKKTAMAVRDTKGNICLERWENNTHVAAFFRLPIIRGVYGMVTSFVVGYKCLMRSAEISMEGLEQAETDRSMENSNEAAAWSADAAVMETMQSNDAAKDTEETSAGTSVDAEKKTDKTAERASDAIAASEPTVQENAAPRAITSKDGQKVSGEKKESNAVMAVAMSIGTVLGVLLAVGLFIYLPTLIYDLSLQKLITSEGYLNQVLRSLFEGLLKIAILVIYMTVVSLIKDIRRTFMYHGAEHKTIFCYENGLPLSVENIRPMRRFHPRCGTSFLILMLLVSIIIGAFIPFDGILRAVCKLLLLPLTIGIGYELIKLAGRRDNFFTRIISAPGMWLQHITTKEPTDDMIECAIAAMVEVIPENQADDNW